MVTHNVFEVNDKNIVIDVDQINKLKDLPRGWLVAPKPTIPRVGLTWTGDGFVLITSGQAYTPDSNGQVCIIDEIEIIDGVPQLNSNQVVVDGVLPELGQYAKSDGTFVDFIHKVIVTEDTVRIEAQRRLMLAFGARSPEHLSIKIQDAQLRGAILTDKEVGGTVLTTDETTEATKLRGSVALYFAIKQASNILERALPIDYKEDRHWP